MTSYQIDREARAWAWALQRATDLGMGVQVWGPRQIERAGWYNDGREVCALCLEGTGIDAVTESFLCIDSVPGVHAEAATGWLVYFYAED